MMDKSQAERRQLEFRQPTRPNMYSLSKTKLTLKSAPKQRLNYHDYCYLSSFHSSKYQNHTRISEKRKIEKPHSHFPYTLVYCFYSHSLQNKHYPPNVSKHQTHIICAQISNYLDREWFSITIFSLLICHISKFQTFT